MSVLLTFLGRLHPVIVHLPIGIILVALLLQIMSVRASFSSLKPAADLVLGIGVLSAVASCCTGYLLSLSGDYDHALVTTHLWLAVSLTVVTCVLYFLLRRRAMNGVSRGLSAASLLLVVLTGHWGGSLTHGPGFLTADMGGVSSSPLLRPVPNVQGAAVYATMVQPVLHDNCYGCHSGGRVRGGLRLDGQEMITRGGKDGPVIVPGNALSSLLVKRILLPLDDEHHMTPSGKPQLTKAEVELLQWWISTGASFDKTVAQLPQDNAAHAMLAAFQDGTAGPVAGGSVVTNVADSDMPVAPVAAASGSAIRRLTAAGALVLPIASGSSYLSVSFPMDTLGRDAISALSGVHEQLVELKCCGLPVGDEVLSFAASCPHLVRLWLDHTHITAAGLGQLRGLDELRYLNLTGTSVDSAAVRGLVVLPKLKQVYLYRTSVSREGWAGLQAAFAHTVLDSGGYRLPALGSDTAVVRAPAVVK